MSYSFYDWNQALQQRNEYVEDRLKDGSPVIAVSFEEGILLLTLRAAQQRKVFEVYDRLMMGALGKQSDIESLRLAAIDSAHKEGFERSPDDVSIQRLVGFGLSPAVKRVYNDNNTIPLTLRAIFVEMHKTAENDHLFVLGYDGEFATREIYAVAAGSTYAEEQAETALRESAPTTLPEALSAALNAWGIARARLAPISVKKDADEDEDDASLKASDDPAVAVREALKDKATVEAGFLSRRTNRESKFRLLTEAELASALEAYK